MAKYIKPFTRNEFVIAKTQQFPSMLNNVSLPEDKIDLIYDVEPLFTNISNKEIIDIICDEVYHHKKLKPICK